MRLKDQPDMRRLPEPTPVTEPKPTLPVGRWPTRAARAVFIEHRLPTSVANALDRMAIKGGLPYKTLLVNDPEGGFNPARIRVRKQSSDPFFVEGVFDESVYTPPGYEICESDTVIDVGANIGAFAIFAARRARKGRVITIEPSRESFSILEKNIKSNGLDNVIIEYAAITGVSGPVTLHLSDLGTGDHSIEAVLAGETSQSEQIAGITLADLFSKHDINICDFLKLNCEGAEFPIMESLSPELARRLQRIALAYHTQPDAPKREQSDAIAGRLLEFGFTIDVHTDVLETNRGMLFARR